MPKKGVFTQRRAHHANQGYVPADIRRLYNFPTEYSGMGQVIGILEFSNGYSLTDAILFWELHGINVPNVTFVSVDGTRNDGGRSPDDEEASLDLQWAGALAPGAQLLVYEANAGDTYASFDQSVIQTLQYILNDKEHHPSVLSISYGDAEATIGTEASQQIADLIAQLSANGVTVCIASGDQGAYGMHDLNGPNVVHADAPATSPQAVAVGGTHLESDGTETVWSYYGQENGGATGGGFSSVFSTPTYQTSLGIAVGRGIPDVALNADPETGYQIIFQRSRTIVGGTSVACPVFAAMVALANEARASHGLPALRNLTEVLYSTALQGAYKDITVGNNTFNNVDGYAAGPGWDACTGFGSVNASAFIQALATLQQS